MPVRVLKSQVPPDFDGIVQAHIAALLAHRDSVGVPAPTAHPLVEQSIRRVQVDGQPDEFAADYEIIDDTPPPPSLRERKDRLLADVSAQEAARVAEVLPPAKRRFFAHRAQDIAQAEQKRTGDIQLRRAAILTKADGERTQDDLAFLSATQDIGAIVAAGRSADDAAFLADEAARHDRLDRIARHAAKLHHDIEDLTAETIDAWRPAPFPEV